MAIEQIGIGDGLEQPLCQHHRVLGARQPALDDRELVGIESRQRVLLAQGGAQPLGDAAQELVADRMPQRVVDRLEIVEPEDQQRDLVGAAPRMQQHLVHLLPQQAAVGQAGQGIMLGHEGEPRLGALALGDVHQREQNRRTLGIGQFAGIDRKVDQRAVGLDVLPGAAGLFLAVRVGDPGRLAVEGLQGADLQPLELGAAVAVMRDRGVIHGDDVLVVQRADDHGHGVAVEQEAERRLALLQFGDVDAQADDAAVVGQALVDQDDAAVRQRLLVPRAGLIELSQPLGDPTRPRDRPPRDSRRGRRRCAACLRGGRLPRTGRRSCCRSRRISCSRGRSGLQHRETRCPAAGYRWPGAGVRGICARWRSRLPPRRGCAGLRRARRGHARARSAACAPSGRRGQARHAFAFLLFETPNSTSLVPVALAAASFGASV